MTPPTSPHAAPRGATPRPRVALEVASAFAVATIIAAVLYRVPRLEGWFHVVVAALFLYLPVWILRNEDLARFGLRADPLGRNLLLAAATALVVFPPFLVAFAAWAKIACAVPAFSGLAPMSCRPGGLFSHFALHLPPSLLDPHPGRNLLLAELLVVALPEEFFFRGYVQTRLDALWPAARRLGGAPVGLSLVSASALFALCHLAVQGNPSTLAVFFPGLLFGWLRGRSGSILPGVVFHALCNVYIETLNRSFLG